MHDNSPEKSEVAATLARTSSSGSRPWLKRLLTAAIILAVLVAALYWWQRDTPTTAPQYKTQPIQRGDLQVIITATGNLAPVNQVQVGSELSGIVKSVDVDYNDRVRVGQVLARLDTSKLEAQVLQSRASLEATRAKVLQTIVTVKETTRNLERLQSVMEMSQGKAISKHDLEAAQAALDRARADQASAEASVNQTEAVLTAIETDRSKTVIRSPINGVVLSRSVDPGQTVAASLQAPVLFSLAEDLAKMELHVDVDEADVGQVTAGQTATFTVDAFPERSFPARTSQVRYGSKTVDGVVTYETLLDVDNSDLSLRPGMTATANITVKEVRDALLIPNGALRFTPPAKINDSNKSRSSGSVLSRLFPRPRRNGPTRKETTTKGAKKVQRVWVMREGGVLTPIPVSTGATDGVFTEIIDNSMQPGEELVVDIVSAKP
ncbi:MAG: efflux RND transporter periplasmic adaptor subunit [Proteobacteria bacterium]|nr:efflux RND transporter periplasmic adaptor subunit [Pseudomonadota bacterium]MBU1710620.1 efflux RND transporter periplasmic adaptor subunit [Pseudomonadota bacterium]